MNQQRLKLVVENMKKAGLHQMIVTETEPVYYLTGIWVAPMERMMAEPILKIKVPKIPKK